MDTGRIVRHVLDQPAYAVAALFGAVGTVFLSELIRNPSLIYNVLVSGALSLRARLQVFVALLFGRPFDPVADGGFLLISVLTGIVFALTVYRIRTLASSERDDTAGASAGIGVVAGVFGGGCTSCGSALLASVFGTSVASGITVLPFGGTELLGGSIILLLLSMFWLATSFKDTCHIDSPNRGT